MELKLAQYYSDKYPKGHAFGIDDIMRSSDCISGVKVRVHMGKSPMWLDLGWFVPQNKTRSSKARTRRGAGVGKNRTGKTVPAAKLTTAQAPTLSGRRNKQVK